MLIGFLTGVGIQVFTGQIPDMLGIPKGTGNWFEQQWSTITHVGDASGRDGRVRRSARWRSSWGSSGSCRGSRARSSP